MPTLHRYTNQPGYFVRGVSNGKPVAFQLTGEGEQYLIETLGLSDGAKFSGDTLKWLYRRNWATNMDPPPEPVPEPAAAPSESAGRARRTQPGGLPGRGPHPASPRSITSCSTSRPTRSSARCAAAGPSSSARCRCRSTSRRTSSSATGTRHPYPIRQYQRLFQVRQARRRTIESMNEFRLPREVDVQVEMK